MKFLIGKTKQEYHISLIGKIILTVLSGIVTGAAFFVNYMKGAVILMIIEAGVTFFIIMPALECLFSDCTTEKQRAKKFLWILGAAGIEGVALFIFSKGLDYFIVLFIVRIIGNIFYYLIFCFLRRCFERNTLINLYRYSFQLRYALFIVSNVATMCLLMIGELIISLSILFSPVLLVMGCFFGYKKWREKTKQLKEATCVVYGLQDFYVGSPREKKIKLGSYKSFCNKKGRIKYSSVKNNKKFDVSKAIFFYDPDLLACISEGQEEECFLTIIENLEALQQSQKNVIIVVKDCGKKENEKIDAFKSLVLERGMILIYGDTNWEAKDTSMEFEFANQSIEVKSNAKNDYVINQISYINNIKEPAEKFYGLIKMVEYVFQYRGLYAMSVAQESKGGSVSFSMGYWNDRQLELGTSLSVEDDKLREAMQTCARALNVHVPNRAKTNYRELCELLVILRNKYIGHGTISYSVSNELLHATELFVYYIVKQFVEEDIQIEPFVSKLSPVYAKEKDIVCMMTEKGRNYMLTYYQVYDEEIITDYINFETGKIISCGKMKRQNLALNGEICGYGKI